MPFFSVRGFQSGPTGLFNSATDGEWRAGETGSFRVASTNDPELASGATVELGLYADDKQIAHLETTV